jgi:hypothetical protein
MKGKSLYNVQIVTKVEAAYLDTLKLDVKSDDFTIPCTLIGNSTVDGSYLWPQILLQSKAGTAKTKKDTIRLRMIAFH